MRDGHEEDMMEEQKNVKTIGELKKSVQYNAENTIGCLEAYETSRSTDATEEEKFNEGRHGRALLVSIDATHQALTALRMRVSLQLEGRDNARARQLDRILGLSEEESSTFQERVTDVRAYEVDEGGATP